MAATVLYSPEGGGRPCRLSAVVPIELELDAPGVTQESIPVAMLSLTGVEARMLNPRKLLVRAVVYACVECYDRTATAWRATRPGTSRYLLTAAR